MAGTAITSVAIAGLGEEAAPAINGTVRHRAFASGACERPHAAEREQLRAWLMVVVQLGLLNGLIFAFSFLAKVLDIRGLRGSVANYNVIPSRLAGAAGLMLLSAEGAVAFSSIVRPGTRIGLIGACI